MEIIQYISRAIKKSPLPERFFELLDELNRHKKMYAFYSKGQVPFDAITHSQFAETILEAADKMYADSEEDVKHVMDIFLLAGYHCVSTDIFFADLLRENMMLPSYSKENKDSGTIYYKVTEQGDIIKVKPYGLKEYALLSRHKVPMRAVLNNFPSNEKEFSTALNIFKSSI